MKKKVMTLEDVEKKFAILLDIVLNSDSEDNVTLAQKEWAKLKIKAKRRWPEIYGD